MFAASLEHVICAMSRFGLPGHGSPPKRAFFACTRHWCSPTQRDLRTGSLEAAWHTPGFRCVSPSAVQVPPGRPNDANSTDAIVAWRPQDRKTSGNVRLNLSMVEREHVAVVLVAGIIKHEGVKFLCIIRIFKD